MRSPAAVVFVWALLLGGLALVLALWTLDAMTNGLLFGAAAAAALVAALALAAGREAERRTVPDLSLGPALIALGAAMLVAGTVFGLWLLLLGAGVLVVGSAVAARERL